MSAVRKPCRWRFAARADGISTGREEDYSGAATAVMPWLGKRSTKRTTFLYDPPVDVEVEPEDVPEEGG